MSRGSKNPVSFGKYKKNNNNNNKLNECAIQVHVHGFFVNSLKTLCLSFLHETNCLGAWKNLTSDNVKNKAAGRASSRNAEFVPEFIWSSHVILAQTQHFTNSLSSSCIFDIFPTISVIQFHAVSSKFIIFNMILTLSHLKFFRNINHIVSSSWKLKTYDFQYSFKVSISYVSSSIFSNTSQTL